MYFKYFWILCGLWVGLGAFAYGNFKAGPLIKQGLYTRSQVNRYLTGFLICTLIPCLSFWLVQQTGSGIEHPFFMEWPDPQRSTAIGLLVFFWISLATWVFVLKGATPLSKTITLITNAPASLINPSRVKVFVAIMLVFWVVSLAVQSM